MPLSEHEQRILADIEARLREDDPSFASSVATPDVAAHWRRRLRLVAVVFAIGFILLFVGLSVHLLWGVLGFGLMLASAYQGLVTARKIAASSSSEGSGGTLQRYLDAARRRDDEGS